MAGILLNHISVIICPHGGIVVHTPTTNTSYRIDGQFPMLISDLYLVVGCPFDPRYGGGCTMVTWVTGSTNLIIKGQPALVNSSVGICISASGMASAPAIVTAINSMTFEPETFTVVND